MKSQRLQHVQDGNEKNRKTCIEHVNKMKRVRQACVKQNCNKFQKDFCLAHADVAAINKLESTAYYQKTRLVDNYLDEFLDLVMEVGYTDLKITVVKFQKGLDPQIQNTIATMAWQTLGLNPRCLV